jgi:hypothetical protein
MGRAGRGVRAFAARETVTLHDVALPVSGSFAGSLKIVLSLEGRQWSPSSGFTGLTYDHVTAGM